MSTTLASAPDTSEYAPYYGRYISLVGPGEIIGTLESQAAEMRNILDKLSEQDGSLRYAPGKWTIKQMFGHMIDTERIFAYRALRISRGDQTPIEGFEQDGYVDNGPFEHCALSELAQEYSSVRNSTLHLFRNLQPADWKRRGTASGKEVSVRALAYMIAGHELHHRNILREKYLTSVGRHSG
jgi:uncharacterized damage-inducible protein DinB